MTAHVIAREKKEDDARISIASRVLRGYLLLLVLTVLVPVLLYAFAPVPDDSKLTAVKELSTSLTAGLSSLTRVLGFVLGYYFKSQDKKDDVPTGAAGRPA